METFSTQLAQWLSRNRALTGQGTFVSSVHAGRSLGPASGNLGDVYPFTVPNALTGLLAGLNVSGFDSGVKTVCVLEYRSKHGFTPTLTGPCAGTAWQKMTGEDWSKIVVMDDPPIQEIPKAIHEVDLKIAFDHNVYKTATWEYRVRNFSPLYRLHCWQRPDGRMVTAVTFAAVSEFLAPFLRPCFAAADDAAVDPAGLFPLRRNVKLFGGLAVLTAGTDIALAAETIAESAGDDETTNPTGTTIHVSKTSAATSPVVRTLCGVPADRLGNIALASTGSHKVTRQYEELDIESGRVTLIPHTLFILSRDTPCCSCDDYVETYETIRKLFRRQAAAIKRFNEAYETLKQFRNFLHEHLLDAAKLIRVRREKTVFEEKTQTIRCDLAIVYSNMFDKEYEHKGATLKLVSQNGLMTIRDVKPLRKPDGTFEIVRFTSTTFELPPITTAAYSHKAIRLEVILDGFSITEEFSFIVS